MNTKLGFGLRAVQRLHSEGSRLMKRLGKKLGLNVRSWLGDRKKLLNLRYISELNQLGFGDFLTIRNIDHEFVKLCLGFQE